MIPEELVAAAIHLMNGVFGQNKSSHPTRAGEFRAGGSQPELADRLACVMRHLESAEYREDFATLRRYGITVDEKRRLTLLFLAAIRRLKRRLGYSSGERLWYIKSDEKKKQGPAKPATVRRKAATRRQRQVFEPHVSR